MFRKKGIIVLLVIAAVIFGISLLLTDAWLESRLEETGSSLNGAKVEFDGIDFSLFGPRLSWDRLQITDTKNTMKNIIETGHTEFKMEFWPLFSKKIIIENIQLTGFRMNTDRETDGKIIKKKTTSAEKGFLGKTIDNLGKQIGEAPAFNMSAYKQKINVDSVMALLKIDSPSKIDSLQKSLTQKYDGWQAQLSGMDIEADTKRIERQVKGLDIKKINSVQSFQSSLNDINQIKKSADSLSNILKNSKQQLSDDLKSARNSTAMVDDWIQDDYKKAVSMAKLPEINSQNIGKFLFGKTVVNQVNQYLGYVSKARTYAAKLQSDKPEKAKPPRLKGQDIYFYNKNARPDFWIRMINLSGETNDGIQIKGEIRNIVSNQRIIGKTTDMDIKGFDNKGRGLSITGELDYLGEKPSEHINLLYKGFSLNNMKLSDSQFLPNKVKKGRGSVESNFDISGDKITGNIKFVGSELQFEQKDTQDSKNKLESIVRDIIKGTSTVDFIARISGEKDNLKFSLNSNLDDQFVSGLKSVISKDAEEARAKIKAKVDQEVGKRREELNNLISGKEEQLKAQLTKYEDLLSDKLNLIDDKKEEIEKEKSKLGDQVKDKLKNLFK